MLAYPDTTSLYKTAAGHAALAAWYDAALARLDAPYETLLLPTRFGPTHVVAAGAPDAPPVVLLNTWGGNALLWSPQIPALARRFRVLAVDVPGQTGRSAPAQLSPNNGDTGAWLGDLLDGLGAPRADLVGVSYGSWLALRAANTAPERVGRVALLSPPFLAPVGLGVVREAAAVAFNPLIPLEQKARHFARAVLTPRGLQLTSALEPVVEWFVLFARHGRYLSPTPLPPSSNLFQPPAAELRRLNAPALVLIGRHEVMYDATAALANARRYLPRLAEADVVPGAGHAVTHNQPAIVNERLLAFLGAAE